tara:strand:- start:38 stop:313 length:276 start_codon:yes stop_codon:yes gene_type:complete
MEENSEQFLTAAEVVKKLDKKPTDDELLFIYGFYKQATIGDNNTSEPVFIDFKGKKKWNAWMNNKSMTKYNAEVNYITEVNKLITKYGIKN